VIAPVVIVPPVATDLMATARLVATAHPVIARGDRPFGDKPRGDRKPREDGERPRSFGDRPARSDRPYGDRPARSERPAGDRPPW
jgi:hypothetical protein